MPVEAFWLQNPLPIPMVYTSLFNSPRSYGPHEGVDLAATDANGDPVGVLAAQSGMVVKVGFYASGYGHYITIRHEWSDGQVFVTWYGHLSRSDVRAGDYVSVGDPIGTAGSSGNSTGVHLHLTLQHIGKGLTGYVVPDVVDPRPYFKSSQPAIKQLAFIADETIPDGTLLQPGTAFTKTWKIANSGTLDWQVGDQLVFVEGEKMGAPDSLPLPPLKSGEQASVSVDMLTPSTQGRYRSTWKGRSANGEFFELPLWVEILNAGATAADGALYLEDVSIPDGTILQPGQTFLKSWRVRNTGSSAWRSGYQLAHSDDQRLGAPESVPVPYTRAGEEAVLSVSLQAPQSSGDFRSTWRLRNLAGEFFGPPLWVQVQVQASTPSEAFSGLQFVADISLPPGSRLNGGQNIQKTWRVRNTGETTWDAGYQLELQSGDALGSPNLVSLPVAAPGAVVDVSLSLKTPSAPGIYSASWQARDDQGRPFGDALSLELEVMQAVQPGVSLDDAQFVKDVTILDGSSIPAGSKFLKTWRVRNSGTSTWNAGYQLDYFQHERLGAQAIALTSTPPGSVQDLTLELTAPLSPGTYRSTWRLRNPQGDFFGHEFYTMFQVPSVTPACSG